MMRYGDFYSQVDKLMIGREEGEENVELFSLFLGYHGFIGISIFTV